ncbi:hypothetical protein J3U66_01430, partial [Gilliamella sp. B2969]|uniref:hypothetical protein n=1 Tax=Gilliamella sp. B2969 TaxID=2818021 RepID=UPI0022699B74
DKTLIIPCQSAPAMMIIDNITNSPPQPVIGLRPFHLNNVALPLAITNNNQKTQINNFNY